MIFARKNARILHNTCLKNIFPDIFLGGKARVPRPRLLRLCPQGQYDGKQAPDLFYPK